MSRTEDKVRIIEKMFNARTIAVVGASNDPRKFGYMTLDSIIRGGYEGKIYPVNPKSENIQGLETYPSLRDIPERVEMIVVLVPAKFVPNILREASDIGVVGAVVCSGGFREAGRSDLEEELRSISKETGIGLIGPNVAGVNYLPNKMCAMFFPVLTTRGPIAIVSQSGTVTNALSEWAVDDNLGISAAINLGNQIDLCESDFLDFLASDKNTRTIAMYLEGVADGRRFIRSLERAVSQKPVAILKGGRTEVGKKSAYSHTGSLAADQEVFSGACRQCGAFVADTLEALYDCAKALATMRPINGNRIFSISSSGGAGTLAADVAGAYNLSFPELPEALKKKLENLELSHLASFANPFDTGADLDAEHFKEVALLVDQSDMADVIFMNFGDPVVGATEMVRDLDTMIKSSLAIGYFAGGKEEKIGRKKMHEAGFSVFPSPERAMRAIGVAAQDARFRKNRKQSDYKISFSGLPMNSRKVRRQVFLTEPQSIDYLKKYRIPYPMHGLAHSIEEAVKIADNLGYPVVLKVVSPQIPHKTDIGGVSLGVVNPEDVAKEYVRIVNLASQALPEAYLDGVLVCQQVPAGLELIVGALEDPLFGPVVMFGLGGVYAELIRDVTFRIAPLERAVAEEMVQEIKGYPILMSTRGGPAYNIEKLIDLLCSVSRVVIERPEIKELDLNPVRLYDNQLIVLDVGILKREWADSPNARLENPS